MSKLMDFKSKLMFGLVFFLAANSSFVIAEEVKKEVVEVKEEVKELVYQVVEVKEEVKDVTVSVEEKDNVKELKEINSKEENTKTDDIKRILSVNKESKLVSLLVYSLNRLGNADSFNLDIASQNKLIKLINNIVDQLHYLLTGRARTFKFEYNCNKK